MLVLYSNEVPKIERIMTDKVISILTVNGRNPTVCATSQNAKDRASRTSIWAAFGRIAFGISNQRYLYKVFKIRGFFIVQIALNNPL